VEMISYIRARIHIPTHPSSHKIVIDKQKQEKKNLLTRKDRVALKKTWICIFSIEWIKYKKEKTVVKKPRVAQFFACLEDRF